MRRYALFVLAFVCGLAIGYLLCLRPARKPPRLPPPAPTQDIIVFRPDPDAPNGTRGYHLRVVPEDDASPDLWEVAIMDDDRSRWQTVKAVPLGPISADR